MIISRYRPEVSNVLTERISAESLPDLEKYRQESQLDDSIDGHLNVDLLVDLLEHAAELDLEDSALDGWLAPRLHSVIRVSRRVASDQGFWSWLALEHGHPYIISRFGEGDPVDVAKWRYTGTWSRNALSRLWWGAELTRNGADYSLVESTFKRVRTAQFALELKYSWYRPAAIAFVNVAEGLDGRGELSDSGNQLSTTINALIPLKPIEAIGPDEQAMAYDDGWRSHTPTLAELTSDSLPKGPSDGFAGEQAISAIAEWFRELASHTERGE